jgi:hypothetical protein
MRRAMHEFSPTRRSIETHHRKRKPDLFLVTSESPLKHFRLGESESCPSSSLRLQRSGPDSIMVVEQGGPWAFRCQLRLCAANITSLRPSPFLGLSGKLVGGGWGTLEMAWLRWLSCTTKPATFCYVFLDYNLPGSRSCQH